MQRYQWLLIVLLTGFVTACNQPANVRHERATLMAADRQWSHTITDLDQFLTFLAPSASIYPPGMPMVTGEEAIRATLKEMMSAPGFSMRWTARKADVGTGGDIGYTTGTYEISTATTTEKGKYVTVWRKQDDGSWKVVEDIFNPDTSPQPKPSEHVVYQSSQLKWGDAPAALPRGAKVAVLSGDPAKEGIFVMRIQFPAGYKVSPHWHPNDENVTVLSGTMRMGMGDTFDESGMKDLTPGTYMVMPAQTRHFAMAKTAATIQVHGMGPFAVNYVNPADDPRQSQAQ